MILATGETPMGMYRELAGAAQRGELDATRAARVPARRLPGPGPRRPPLAVRLDEADPSSTRSASRLRNVVRLPGDTPDPEAACRAYEEAVREAGGIDLAVLGLGPNGHLGFNEPPVGPALSDAGDRADARRASRATRATGVAAIRFPRQAMTAGMAVLLAARHTLLVVSGERKRAILRRAVEGPVTPDVPASYLQQAPNVTVIADRAAAVDLAGQNR